MKNSAVSWIKLVRFVLKSNRAVSQLMSFRADFHISSDTATEQEFKIPLRRRARFRDVAHRLNLPE